MDTKKVDIIILTSQTDRDGTEDMELKTEGEFWVDDDNQYCVKYVESATTGYEGSVTTIYIGNNNVTIKRVGDYSAILILEKGREHYGHYLTPAGGLEIGTRTYTIRPNFNSDGGTLYLRYGIYVNGAFLNLTKMKLTVSLGKIREVDGKDEFFLTEESAI